MNSPAGHRSALWLAAAILCLWAAASAPARAAAAAKAQTVTIGYVQLDDDPRYRIDNSYAGIVLRTLGRPLPGAELGISDAAMMGSALGIDFRLVKSSAKTEADLEGTVSGWIAGQGVHFVITDLAADDLLKLADAEKGKPVLFMNVSARQDSLRGEDCRANIVHLIPSDSMLTDALAQYLVARNWRDIFVLQGPAPQDARKVAALRRSAAKFGARLVAVKPFVLGEDPRRRDENNVALMTAGVDADVVFVADWSREFARYIPYNTSKPQPVVGDAGLVATAWHWSWYRNGAPQLQHRFEKIADPRRMNPEAWAAWVAVKAVTQSAARAGSLQLSAMQQFMLGSRLNLDGAKGEPMSFRPWDHQLRQPILLATADAVIARAPLPQFLHQTNDLDTLGIDRPETRCRF